MVLELKGQGRNRRMRRERNVQYMERGEYKRASKSSSDSRVGTKSSPVITILHVTLLAHPTKNRRMKENREPVYRKVYIIEIPKKEDLKNGVCKGNCGASEHTRV